jgi:hypothetical protein
LENRRAKQVPPRGEGWHHGKGELAGKVGRRVNIMQKMCTRSCKCKEVKRVVVNSSMIYLIHCKNLCKGHNVPPASTIKGKKKKFDWLNILCKEFSPVIVNVDCVSINKFNVRKITGSYAELDLGNAWLGNMLTTVDEKAESQSSFLS